MTIPDPVKRVLRQEAGFGCCVCGVPIFQYHHVIPRHIEQHDRPEDMMVLCPNHHWEVTSGAMLEKEQREHKASPFNIRRGYADGLLKVNQSYCAIMVGSCDLVNDSAVILVNDEALPSVSIVEYRVSLSLTLYDDDDQVLVLIDNNEWLAGDPALWDLEATHQRLIIRRGERDVRLRLDVSREPMRLQASLRRRGQAINLRPRGIEINGVVKGAEFQDLGFVGMRFAIDTASESLQLQPDPRFGSGKLVSNPDRIARIMEGIEALNQLGGLHQDALKPALGPSLRMRCVGWWYPGRCQAPSRTRHSTVPACLPRPRALSRAHLWPRRQTVADTCH